MIVHVATHAEARGRVVLRITRDISPLALDAAGRVARAYDAEIDAVLIEDENLFAATAYPFACEISPNGGRARPLDARAIAREYADLSWRANSLIADWSRQNDVPVRFRRLRGPPRVILARACAENGPWNVVVFAEALAPDSRNEIAGVLAGVADSTGLVLVGGPRVDRVGQAVLLVEHSSHLTPMLGIADRLHGEDSAGVVIIPVTHDDEEGRRLDGDLRLALARHDGEEDDAAAPVLSEPYRQADGAAALVERIARVKPTLLIARGRGILDGQTRALSALVKRTGAAVFLTRD